MSASTYEEQLDIVQRESKSLTTKLSYIVSSIFFKSIWFFRKRRLKAMVFGIFPLLDDYLNRLETVEASYCASCLKSDCSKKIKDYLGDVVVILKQLHEVSEPLGMSKEIGVFLEKYENKLDNYWLAGDKESRKMVDSFIKEMQNHPKFQ